MTDYREEAGFDVSRATDYGRSIKKTYAYAVAQREARLRLEDELKQPRRDALEEAAAIVQHSDAFEISLIERITKLEALVMDYQVSSRGHFSCGNGRELCSICRRADELLAPPAGEKGE